MKIWFFCSLFVCCIGVVSCMDDCNNCSKVGYDMNDSVNVVDNTEQQHIQEEIHNTKMLWNSFNIFRDYVGCYLETVSNNGRCYAGEVCNDIAREIAKNSIYNLRFYSYWDAMSIVLSNYDLVNDRILGCNGFLNSLKIVRSIIDINADNYVDLSKRIKDIIFVKDNELELIQKIATWIVLNGYDSNTVSSESYLSYSE